MNEKEPVSVQVMRRADVELLASVLALSAVLRLRCDEASVIHAGNGA